VCLIRSGAAGFSKRNQLRNRPPRGVFVIGCV
jgi:hypothetical protein